MGMVALALIGRRHGVRSSPPSPCSSRAEPVGPSAKINGGLFSAWASVRIQVGLCLVSAASKALMGCVLKARATMACLERD